VDPVLSLNSIAHLFGQTKKRCGIYLLEFPNSVYYIGQAIDVVRRFSQHRRGHNDIVGFSFIPTPAADLNTVERDLIFRAEKLGLKIINAVHVTNIIGETDLDLILSSVEQEAWLRDPCLFNGSDTASSIQMTETQQLRFAKNFNRFVKHPLASKAIGLLQHYIMNCVPTPKRTEYSFWSVSCMPNTNLNTWPRLFCVNAAMMETFVVGFERKNNDALWSFINVAKSTLVAKWGSLRSFNRSFPFAEIVDCEYRDAGGDQVGLHVYDNGPMEDLLADRHVCQAAAILNLRVMRKRATIYCKYHCSQLASRVLHVK
jgi:hypothetical protein